jgi:uncharacterized protein
VKIQGTALITGASSGIGREYATQLTRRGCEVILTARRAERLEEVARQIRAEADGRVVTYIPADLSDAADVRRLLSELAARGVVPDLLINNAGRGYFGPAVNAPVETVQQMLRLNMEALTVLSLELGRAMAERGSGGIINIASTAAFQPIPQLAVYAATKAYVVSFSEALAAELFDRGVRVFTVSPGATRSEFMEAAGMDSGQFKRSFDFAATTAEALVSRSLRAFETQVFGDSYVDGALNQAGALLSSFAPRFLLIHFAQGLLRPRD